MFYMPIQGNINKCHNINVINVLLLTISGLFWVKTVELLNDLKDFLDIRIIFSKTCIITFIVNIRSLLGEVVKLRNIIINNKVEQ